MSFPCWWKASVWLRIGKYMAPVTMPHAYRRGRAFRWSLPLAAHLIVSTALLRAKMQFSRANILPSTD